MDSLQLIPPRKRHLWHGPPSAPYPPSLSWAPASLSDGLKKQSFTTTAARAAWKGLITTRLDASVPGLEATASRSASGVLPSLPVMKRVSDGYAVPPAHHPAVPKGLPYLTITDSARLAYRGVMLDVSRHFMNRDMIIVSLDEMARYKLNRFHWHLVDGGGWPLPSKKTPS